MRDQDIYFHSMDAILKWVGASYKPSLPDPYVYKGRYFREPVYKAVECMADDGKTVKVALGGENVYRRETIKFNGKYISVWVKEHE